MGDATSEIRRVGGVTNGDPSTTSESRRVSGVTNGGPSNLNVSGGDLNPALQGIEAALVVNNLLDKNYLGGISGQGAWIGAPRTVALSISATF